MPSILKICTNCNLKFPIEQWRLKDKMRGQFCSRKCFYIFNQGENSKLFGRKRLDMIGEKNNKWKGGLPSCIDCKKQISIYSGKRCIICSNKFRRGKNHYLYGKRRIEFSGENNPSWKGGVTTQNKLDRQKFTKTMQKLVFERDNYTCQLCGNKRDLQVDHIQSWAEYIESRFKMENCRTVCSSCHYQITFGKQMPKHIKTWGHNLKTYYKKERGILT